MDVERIVLEKTSETLIANQKGSSEFFFDINRHLLAKVKNDKYTATSNALRWFGRIIHERILLQADAIKEHQGNKIFINAGIKTVPSHGYAIALNPLNHHGSIFFIEYLNETIRGSDYFNRASEEERIMFLEKFCVDVLRLAKYNYYCRDAHFGNTLVGNDNELTWIDTHVYRLPLFSRNKYTILLKYFIRKIPSAYQNHAEKILHEKFHSSLDSK